MISHAVLLHIYYGLGQTASIVDSIVYNISFCGLGVGFWYIVRYVQPDRQDRFRVMSAHIIAAMLAVTFWVFAFRLMLKGWMSAEEQYIVFLDETMVIRAIIGLIYYLLIILVYYLIQYYQNLQEKITNEYELNAIIKDTELRALKSQINPHFIFNSLNSVSALTVSKPKKAREMVIKLSDFLRFSLGKSNAEQNTVETELNNIQLYLDIEKVRFGDQLNVEYHIEELCKQAYVPNLILQPLLENAIKYGVSESLDPVTIKISGQAIDDFLVLRISNNYESSTFTSKGHGIGLKNITQRLNLIYGKRSWLKVSDHDGIFEVELGVPLNENE